MEAVDGSPRLSRRGPIPPAFGALSDCVADLSRKKCARLLIESGANLSLKDKYDDTALDLATPSGTTTNSPPTPNRTPPHRTLIAPYLTFRPSQGTNQRSKP